MKNPAKQTVVTNVNGLKGKAIPLKALRFPGVWGSQISRQTTHEGGKVISLKHRPPLPPRKYSWYS